MWQRPLFLKKNYLRLERYDTQNEWGAWNYDQKCMEKGENQNLTTPPFPEKIDLYKGIYIMAQVADFFLRTPTLAASNFAALWSIKPKFSALNDLNLLKKFIKNQEAN